ncbi:AbiV family abortive infection protein [Mucilaginibacter sp. 44-25]|uniref:AbiV family abortive infection protein n=1 Tax=Mucilaginibacter sp. 44-25 TaxID=1895794 RepID=UPI00095D4C35|nr:AbiV family abortive infection protein [Mucilaginibacter sp. 44-25]OJW17273.1 MAG: hypothetical protein BGO48_06875 [Mucilaginibacter sp. 44-25]
MASNTNKSIFRSLNQQQCKDTFELIRQNARRHFSAAQSLSSQSDFSNGVAHLILGTEELIKSAMLMLQGFGFPVRNIRNYDKLFYNHNARHKLLKEYYSVYLFVFNIVEKSRRK